ncbi:MAG: hypothetical protein Tsb0014_36780 [Pleurocapsa sp.]
MSNFPDFTDYGYQIHAELGRNREGGRITWLGVNVLDEKKVVIKQFCFATIGSTWSGYQAYQQEIAVLQRLEHPSIPRYLDSFETESGFCLIQDYKKASTLSDYRPLTLVEIKKVIIQVLEILVYLQQQKPPILHRDIKPENILIDDNLNVYLIDFGFASLGSKEVSASSVFKGTPGFMPPEQIIQPTTASDLYSLGVTIICLLTGKNSSHISELSHPDRPYELQFKSSLPALNRQFVNWLNKMVQPQASKRFPNALAAKNALETIDLEATAAIIPIDTQELNFPAVNKQFILGTGAIAILSTTVVWGLHFVQIKTILSPLNLAIAILTAIVVTVTQIGSLTMILDREQNSEIAWVLGITIPWLLVGTSGFFFGGGEAIATSGAIAVAEIFCLVYFLRQQPIFTTISLCGAIVLGVTLGLGLIF